MVLVVVPVSRNRKMPVQPVGTEAESLVTFHRCEQDP